MLRTKTPRHKLLNELLMQCKNGKHDAKEGFKKQSRTKANNEWRKTIVEDVE